MQHLHRLALLLLTASFCGAGTLSAQDEDDGPARLTLCNKGNRAVSVAIASNDNDFLTGPTLTVSAWGVFKPGQCGILYDWQYQTLVPRPAFLAFAYFSGATFAPARAATIPDIGQWTYHSVSMTLRYPAGHGPVLSRSSRVLCVNQGPLEYEIPLKSQADCGSVHPGGVQGALVPITAQVLFQPSAGRCYRNADYEPWKCGGGEYYLDVAPRTGDPELHATAGHPAEGDEPATQASPQENAAALAQGIRMATEAARKAQATSAPPPPPVNDDPPDFAAQRAQWWKVPEQSVGAYQPSWLNQVVLVRGTVSKVVVTTTIGAGAIIHFKEATNDALVVCAQYANTLRRIYGEDLNALVGKTIEVTGLVEQFDDCSGKGSDIRIFEEGQVRLVSAK